MQKLLDEINKSIFNGNTETAMEKTKALLKLGIGTREIIEGAFVPAFKELGNKMRNDEIFITDVLISSRAMRAAMYVMEPFISHNSRKLKGVVIIGTVAGDLHDIGKDLVAMILSGYGYTVINLGIDVTKEVFIDTVRKYKPDVLAMSALLTTTMPEMKKVIDGLKECGLKRSVKVIVGGNPVNEKFAAAIGADAYAIDGSYAFEAVEDLINNRIGKYSI